MRSHGMGLSLLRRLSHFRQSLTASYRNRFNAKALPVIP
jgi:hypothetical protein